MPLHWLVELENTEHVPVRGIVVSVLLLVIAGAIDRLVAYAFQRSIKRAQATHHEDIATRLWLSRRLARVSVWLIALSLVASEFDTLRTLGTTLLASAGVVGVIVGVAARSTFANLVAGVQIAFTQPIRVGDVVTIRDETGEVEDITLTYTFIKTGDNRRVAIPNDVLSSEVIRNFSLRDPSCLAWAQVSVGYGANVDRVRELLVAAATAMPNRDTKKPPSVAVTELTDTAVRLRVYVWTLTPQQALDLPGALREAAFVALQKANVPLPPALTLPTK